jgi:response regulator of citrate/malate metabolism
VSQGLAVKPELDADCELLPTTWQVLIVEPDTTMAAMFRRGISNKSGLKVAGVVSRGEDALEFMRRHRVDLVVLDLRVAGMNGIQLMDRLRMANSPAEVIVVSGARHSEVVRAVLHRGAVDYLVKPFSPDRLRHALDLFVNRAMALCEDVLDQEMIDRACASGRAQGRDLPKGLTSDGVLRVRCALNEGRVPRCSSEIAELTGLARVTARRYLEHLVATDQAVVETWPSGPGRPRKLYRSVVW